MAVLNQTPIVVSTANGATAVFPYNFLILDSAHLEVKLDGVVSVEGVGHSVSGAGNPTGGNVTILTGNPANGVKVVRKRVMPYTREVDYQLNGDFQSDEVNPDQDAPVMMLQQLKSEVDLAIKLPDDLAGISGTLPAPEALKALRWNGAENGIENYEITPFTSPGGADMVGFLQSGAGMVARTLQSKSRDIFHAHDRGLLGDGVTDETTALQNLMTAAQGNVVMLGYNKTYAIATATGLSLPANTTLIANGSKFKRLTAHAGAVADGDYNIIVGDDCDIDRLEVEAVGGVGDIGGVIIAGSRVNIGTLKVTSAIAGSAFNGLAWNGVRIGPNSGTANDVHIRELILSNWDRAAVVQNIDRWSIGYVSIATYLRGVYLKDCPNGVIQGGYIRTKSANATGAAGDNGILMESLTAHGSLHDIRVNNVTVEDSAEHGYRIGGQYLARNIWHNNCHSKNPGAGNNGANYPPENNGGCGFKVLGPTSVFGARHQNIHYVNCSVEDINATSIANVAARGGKSNFAGFQLGKVFGGSIVNPIVNKRPADTGTYVETGNSCFNGIEIIGCQKITITNPQIQRPYNSGVYIYDFTDGVNDWGQTDDVVIVGGTVQTPGVAGVEVDCSVITMRRLDIDGMQVNAGLYTLKVAKSGAGAFASCHARMRSIGPSTESFNGLGTDWVIHGQANFIGANACQNGSFYQDFNAGTCKVRKAGAWTNL